MGTDRENGKDSWKYYPHWVAGARAQVHANRIRAALLEPVELLLEWLTRKLDK